MISSRIAAGSALIAAVAIAGCFLDLGGLADQSGAAGGGGKAPCTADLSSDPENCDACGRSCHGGKCVDTVCQPVPIASGEMVGNPWGIAVVGDTVYWTVANASSGVRKAQTLSAGMASPLTNAPGPGGALAADADGLFYVTPAGIVRCALSGPCEAGTYAPNGGDDIRALAIDTDYVFWTAAVTGMGDGKVVRCARSANDCAASAVVIAQGLTGPEGLAIDETYVYWAETGSGGVNGRVARVFRDAMGPATPDELIKTGESFHGVAVSPMAVMATAWSAADRVVSCTLPCKDGKVVDLTATTPGLAKKPVGIFLIDTDLYWANTGGASIARCTFPDCLPESLIDGIPAPLAISYDEDTIYWTDAKGSVLRVIQ